MDIDSDLEQLMSNIGQYYFISMNINTCLCDRHFSVPLCGGEVSFLVVGECRYRNKRGVMGCCCPVPDIWSEEG